MLKIIIFISVLNFLSLQSFGQIQSYKAGGAVSDFFVSNDVIVASTLSGTIEWFNLKTTKLISKFSFDPIKDFEGKPIDAEVFKIEKYNDEVVALVHAENGKSSIFLVTKDSKTLFVDGNEYSSIIIDILYLGENKLLIGFLSNEIMLMDLKTKKSVYKTQVSPYIFSAFTLSPDLHVLYVTDESGLVHLIEPTSGKLIKSLKGLHVDNALAVSVGSTFLFTGGKDRRLTFYNLSTKESRYFLVNYFVTVIGQNDKSTYMAWFNDENNSIEVYSPGTKKRVSSFRKHQTMVSKIVFVSDNELVTSDELGMIYYWKF